MPSIEWAGAVAPNATIIYVYAKDVRDAARQVIKILSLSYGTCESNLSAWRHPGSP
jgi:hypothetical protein